MGNINPQRINKLTVKEGQKLTSYPDGNGLSLYVYPEGHKRWRFRCRHSGKEILLSLGTYPAVSLKEAREKAEELYNLNKSGVNPSEHLKAKKQSKEKANSNTFELVAREWIEKERESKAESTIKKDIAALENDALPFIGSMAVSDITPSDMLKVLQRIESRGTYETAHRVNSRCARVFRHAIATGRCLTNPCRDIGDAIKKPKKNNFAAITDPVRFAELLKAIDARERIRAVTRYALRLLPMMPVRNSEFRFAKWGEIKFNLREWHFHITKTDIDQIIPLPAQAIMLLEELKRITYNGDDSFLFPHTSRPGRPMNQAAIISNIHSAGFEKSEMSGHGFRASFKTIMLEMGYPLEWIEKQLGHMPKEAHGTAYNRTEYRCHRHFMMQKWADFCEAIKKAEPEQIDKLQIEYRFDEEEFYSYLKNKKA
ncbi:MAG: hypothetical protein PWR01_2962 [Clostridiales bacterium]|nr:hypothetical protein [Clostridiales bacterium]MDN5281889.1 hypothetical protein [Candidatus Ozemobacter sp.]